MAYLIKSIPADETPEWLEQLDDSEDFFIPLPFQPQRDFDGVVLIYGTRALVFERFELVDGTNIDVSVGSSGDRVVRDKVRLYVSSRSEGTSLINGFQGIRYAELDDVVILAGS